jgi:hypothetical protein
MKAEAAIPVYIQTNLGSTDTLERAIPSAAPMAVVRRYMDITKDFMDGGALVYAYSRPVIEAKISEKAMRTYDGTWAPTLTVLLSLQVVKS